MLTGIIMASGLSKRMLGKNKLLLKLHGTYVFEHTINSILASNIENIVVITCYEEIADFCKKKNIPYIKNSAPQKGQSESIKLGVKFCNKESDFMFFVADQPLLKTCTINKIIEIYEQDKSKIIIPKNKNTPANPRIFPKLIRNEFLSLVGDVRGVWIIENHPELLRYVAIEDDLSFKDIDTIKDYNELLNQQPY